MIWLGVALLLVFYAAAIAYLAWGERSYQRRLRDARARHEAEVNSYTVYDWTREP